MAIGWAVEFLAFFFSFSLLCWSAIRLAAHLVDGWNRFWVAVAAGYLQLAIFTLLLSVVLLLRWEAFFAVQLAVVAGVWYWTEVPVVRLLNRAVTRARKSVGSASRFSLEVAVLLAFVVFCALLTRVVLPLYGWDGLNYVAPRTPHWLQQSHIGYYTIQEPRHFATGFGADYLFLWGVMFTRSELIGRVIYWLGYPLAISGLYTIVATLDTSLDIRLSVVALFATTPVVYQVTSLLQPFHWVLLFAFGAGYWVLQRDRHSFVVAGLFVGLAASAKQQALAAIGGGVVVAGIRNIEKRDVWLLPGFFAAFLCTIVVTGFVLIPARNIAEFGSLFHPVITQGSGGTVSPRGAYVKFVRLIFVLARFPIPLEPLNEMVGQVGQSLLETLGAAGNLPGNSSKMYRFWLPTLPREGFGLTGILMLGFTPYVAYLTIGATHFRDLLRSILVDARFHYTVFGASLLFGPLLLLEMSSTGNSTQTYLGPGILLLFPLVFVPAVDKLRRHDHLYTVFKISIIVYLLAFSGFAGNRAIDNALATGGSIEVIDHANPNMFQPAGNNDNPALCSHPLIDQHVPADGTIVVFSNLKTYSLFGQDYRRHLVPVDRQITASELENIHQQYPNAYLYVTAAHSEPNGTFENRKIIQNSSITVLLGTTSADCPRTDRSTWLYKFHSDR